MKTFLKLGFVLTVIVSALALPGCATSGQGGFCAGIGTNSLFAKVRNSTSTNSYRLILPINPSALIKLFETSEGF